VTRLDIHGVPMIGRGGVQVPHAGDACIPTQTGCIALNPEADGVKCVRVTLQGDRRSHDKVMDRMHWMLADCSRPRL
jgi:hypothetical protein